MNPSMVKASFTKLLLSFIPSGRLNNQINDADVIEEAALSLFELETQLSELIESDVIYTARMVRGVLEDVYDLESATFKIKLTYFHHGEEVTPVFFSDKEDLRKYLLRKKEIDIWQFSNSDGLITHYFLDRDNQIQEVSDQKILTCQYTKQVLSSYCAWLLEDVTNQMRHKEYILNEYNWYWGLSGIKSYSESQATEFIQDLEASEKAWGRTKAIGAGIALATAGGVYASYRACTNSEVCSELVNKHLELPSSSPEIKITDLTASVSHRGNFFTYPMMRWRHNRSHEFVADENIRSVAVDQNGFIYLAIETGMITLKPEKSGLKVMSILPPKNGCEPVFLDVDKTDNEIVYLLESCDYATVKDSEILRTISTSSKESPQEVGSISSGTKSFQPYIAESSSNRKNRIFTIDHKGEYAYFFGPWGFFVLNIFDKENLRIASTYSSVGPNNGVTDIAIDDASKYIYMTIEDYGIEIVDISNPLKPIQAMVILKDAGFKSININHFI